MQLRDYQIEANARTFEFFASTTDPDRHPVVAMPTGTGKAVVIGGLIKQVMTTWPSQRIMMLTHVKELIEQNGEKLRTMWPQAPLGIYSAGLGEKSVGMPVTFGGIQSVAKNIDAFGHQDLVLIDECHLVSPNENASYKKTLSRLREINPRLRVVGYSATPYRLGLGMITDGGIFTDMAFDVTGMAPFNRFLDEGYLSPLVPMPTETTLDVSGIHKRGGEFVASELNEAFVREDITRRALEEGAEAAHNRNHWLIFAIDIAHVEMIVKILNQMGISAAGIHSKAGDTRDDDLARFKAGQIRALVNADILTTGFDFPALDCIMLLRPTSSPGLHVQILGRGTRPLYVPGFDLMTMEGRLASIAAGAKQSCLVLDFAGNTMRLGPINDPRIPKKKGEGTGEMPLKVCDKCGCLNHISARFCVNPPCDHEFTFEEKISTNASTAALIVRDEPVVEMFKVDHVTYAPHVKPFKTPSLKVNYHCGRRRFTEWICLEHGGSIRHKAHAWWRQRSEDEPPATIEEALPFVETLKTPSGIRVWINKQYPEILSYVFEE